MNPKIIKKLLALVQEVDIVSHIKRDYLYPDEPKLHVYSAGIKNIKKYSDGADISLSAGGFSFSSARFALLKCLIETIERFATVVYRDSQISYGKPNELTQSFLDPRLFNKNFPLNHELGWIKGFDLFTKQNYLIPAQVAFLNFRPKEHEPHITERITTGAAGGFDEKTTLLRGVLEIIERDAFMTIYLNKIKAPKVSLAFLNDLRVQQISKQAKKYNLELMLFNITNDLKVPTYLSALVDKTGLGPVVSLGLKSSLNEHDAMIGALEESFHTRPWMKGELLTRQKTSFSIKKTDINSLLDRGLFWLLPKRVDQLSFLTDQAEKEYKLIRKTSLNETQQLEELLGILKNKGFESYYVDITPKVFAKAEVLVYKVIIPKMQPLFLHEKRREIREQRVKDVADYFGLKKRSLNTFPHPFL